MLAEEIIAKFEERGVTVSLSADGESFRITPFSELCADDRRLIKCYKAQIRRRLKNPNGYPENLLTTDLCPDCGAVMASDDGDHYERLTCLAGRPKPYGMRPP